MILFLSLHLTCIYGGKIHLYPPNIGIKQMKAIIDLNQGWSVETSLKLVSTSLGALSLKP